LQLRHFILKFAQAAIDVLHGGIDKVRQTGPPSDRDWTAKRYRQLLVRVHDRFSGRP
jgi:hypothetical protein